MAKKKDNDKFIFKIEEFLGVIKESSKHDWCKAVNRITWGDNPTTVDIRNVNMSNNKIGKGISLSDEEANRVIEILLDHDYGSIELLEKAINKKKKRFTVIPDTANELYVIKIPGVK